MSAVNQSVDGETDLVSRMQKFGIVDYGIFIALLVISSAIGLDFGMCHKKKTNDDSNQVQESIEANYLMGGRKMKIFPVSMSLAASWMSGITLLGMPTEMYVYGTQFLFILIPIILSSVCIHYLFIPVYLDLKMASSYEYLEARFDRKMRYLGGTIFILTNIFVMPIILYVTALAFNQVSGISVHIISPVTCLICIFYTTLGGVKAAVSTDLIQTIIMYGSLIIIIITGTLQVGGISTIWDRNHESGRLEYPTFTFDPTVRHSILAIVLGGTFQVCQTTSISQLYIQRFVSLPNKKAAAKALWVFTIAIVILLLLCFYIGMLIYATYYDCDPVTTKLAQSKDQLLPVLVVDVLKDLPGVAGLFVAGIFSATLSALSTTLTSFSSVILEDFIKPSTKNPISKLTTSIIMHSGVLISGIICVGLVFIVAKFNTLLQLKLTVTSCTSGPLFGIFLIGLFLPWIKSNSALFGGVFGLIIMMWITFKGQIAILNNEIVYELKPTATYGCVYNYTTVMSKPIIEMEPVAPSIYHVSYMWYSFMGTVITIIVAGLASLKFGLQDSNSVDPSLLAPFIRKYFKTEDNAVKIDKSRMDDANSSTETTYI